MERERERANISARKNPKIRRYIDMNWQPEVPEERNHLAHASLTFMSL